LIEGRVLYATNIRTIIGSQDQYPSPAEALLNWKENYVTGAELDQAAAMVQANKNLTPPTMRIPPSLKSLNFS
jgi:hypothetical protein